MTPLRRVLFVGLLASSRLWAASHTAAGVDYASVSSAVAAASDGDTVIIPAGSATWGSTLHLNKAITLQGAGTDTGSSLTRIVRGGVTPIIIALTADLPVRVTGIFFDNVTSSANTDRILVQISGRDWNGAGQELTQVRIDHNTFNQGASQLWAFGWCYGVVDNNKFLNPDIAIRIIGDDAQREPVERWRHVGSRRRQRPGRGDSRSRRRQRTGRGHSRSRRRNAGRCGRTRRRWVLSRCRGRGRCGDCGRRRRDGGMLLWQLAWLCARCSSRARGAGLAAPCSAPRDVPLVARRTDSEGSSANETRYEVF